MLLARLQREDEAAPALEVDGLADQAAGDATHQLGGHGDVAHARAAEVHRVAERLGLTDDDVGAQPARSLEQAERDRVGDHDEQRARRVRQFGHGGQVLERTEEVGLLDDDRRRVLADGGGERVQVGRRARQQTRGQRARPVPGRLRREHLPVLGCTPAARTTSPRRVCTPAMNAASASAVAPSYREALLTSMPVSSQMTVWNSKMDWSVPWLRSGW